LYRAEKWISAINTEEGFKVVIDKTEKNYIGCTTVMEILTMAVLSNYSS
jgi:hypothetical protein